jgi:predicted patatin/cPLA2 family phospholipase
MACGLVLEGGAMRGLFTAGVLDAWMEAGLRFDGLIGVSAGACFGSNFKSRQPGRVLRYNLRYARDPRYCSWASLLFTGNLFGATFCYRDLPRRLDPVDAAAFASDPMPFYVVTTDCRTGRPVYTRLDRLDDEAMDWIRASASMPLVSRPVAVGGSLHLDGGVTDGVPLRFFESIGYARNVVVTTRPRGYRKFPSWKTALAQPFLLRFPAVRRALRERPARYNEALAHVESRVACGAALLVAPARPLPIGRICHDPAVLRTVYGIGRRAGEEAIESVASFQTGAGFGKI